MNKHVFSILVLAGCITLAAQQKGNPDYYSRLGVHNFREDESLNQPVDFENPDYPRLNAAIFYATNEQRLQRKLPLLTYSAQLEETASMHSEDMHEKRFFGHINPAYRKERTPNDRARLAGILNPYLTENIATAFGLQYEQNRKVLVKGPGKFSYPDQDVLIPPRTYLSVADALLKNWMNSEGHKKNILSHNALQLGCGTYMYLDSGFNLMPTFIAAQNFQEYEKIKTSERNK
ncbi:MAG: hypothetical protein JW723_00245 [Bacteroidales bacterium]|nr:hypothetical protein [Bacteroidales bacterium]